MTRAQAFRHAVRVLAEAGIDNPPVDARILLCAAGGFDRVALLRDPDLPIGVEASARLASDLSRRVAREPVSRILGRRAFWGLDLVISPDVLDPRPDTETLVAAALDGLGSDRERPWRILDLGTGSGAILCALLDELPAARGWAFDLSLAACRVARRNLMACGLGPRSLVGQGFWGAACPPHGFDLVVSNPPYVETATIAALEPDVRDYDPPAALDGGPDGLDAYRAIAADLPRLLAGGGLALFEVGAGQAAAVSMLTADAGLSPGRVWRDLAGVDRVVSARA